MSFHSAIFRSARYVHPSIFHWNDVSVFAWHEPLQSILKDSWGFSFTLPLSVQCIASKNYQLGYSYQEAVANLNCPKFYGHQDTLKSRRVKGRQKSQVIPFIELEETCIHLHM